MNLTDKERKLLWVIRNRSAEEILEAAEKAGLSEDELAELKAILSE